MGGETKKPDEGAVNNEQIKPPLDPNVPEAKDTQVAEDKGRMSG